MKTNASPKNAPGKDTAQHLGQGSKELKTDPPISEKDEVKKAEERTREATKKSL